MTKLKQVLSSRKFWAAIAGASLIFIKAYYPQFPLSGDDMTKILALLGSFIVGTAIEDGLSSKGQPTTPPDPGTSTDGVG